MLKILAITPRRKHLCGLSFSEEYLPENARVDATGLLALDSEYIEEKCIKVGQEYDYSDIDDMFIESEKKRAKSKAMWLLSRRDYCSNEMLKKLSEEFPREAAENATARMCELSLINDLQYANHIFDVFVNTKGVSKSRAAYLMAGKGLDRELISRVISEKEYDSKDAIKNLIETKYIRYLGDEKGNKKVIAALQRKGFSYSDIRVCLEPYIKEDYYGDY